MSKLTSMIGRTLAMGAAFVLGWIVYMVAMLATVYDGLLSRIFQPIVGAIFTGFFVTLALLLGLILRLPWFRWWKRGPLPAAVLAATSLGILIFGYFLGLTAILENPETGTQFESLHPGAFLGGYFGLLFAVANWPMPRRVRS